MSHPASYILTGCFVQPQEGWNLSHNHVILTIQEVVTSLIHLIQHHCPDMHQERVFGCNALPQL